MHSEIPQALFRALSFDELLSAQANEVSEKNTELANQRISAWLQSATNGDLDLFKRRLTRDGWGLEGVIASLGAANNVQLDSKQLAWLSDALSIRKILISPEKSNLDLIHQIGNVAPFQELFLGIVDFAYREVCANSRHDIDQFFARKAQIDLLVFLLRKVADLAAPILYSHFIQYLKSNSPEGNLLPSDADIKQNLYDDFLEIMRVEVLEKLLDEKPVLLRLIASVTRQWINASSELINRFIDDQTLLQHEMLQTSEKLMVKSIQTGLSDAHNQGKTVSILELSDGNKIVYKPKDLRLEKVFSDLIEHLNTQKDSPIELKAAKTIPRGQYGWVQFIPHKSCNSEDEFTLFYEKAGAWLMLLHIMVCSDMHYENIIACGSDPVPIDLETILQSSPPEFGADTASMTALNLARFKIHQSVLKAGMLPSYSAATRSQIHDMGSLNATNGSSVIGEWKNINTNGMRWVQVHRTSSEYPNIPHYQSQYAQFGDFIPSFLDGFKRYGEFLIAQKDTPFIKSFWMKLADLPVRKVVRPTGSYLALIQRLKDPRFMHDGIVWSSQSDFLSRLADWDVENDPLWAIQKTERDALLNLNIPIFFNRTNNSSLFDQNGKETKTAALSGISQAQQRWSNLSEQELAWQAELIRISTSFVSRSRNTPITPATRSLESISKTPLTKSSLTGELSKFVGQIESCSYQDQKGIRWIGLDWLQGTEVAQLGTIDFDMYNGMSGIGLFLAAHYHVFKDHKSHELLQKVLFTLREALNTPDSVNPLKNIGIGGATGLGSIVYSLAKIAFLIKDDAVLQDASRAANLISQDMIQADQYLDVISGSAGAILGLLALYRHQKDVEILHKAIACGEHLLSMPRIEVNGHRSWASLGATPLTGFSHGAAGFGFALRSLATASGIEKFELAAQECFLYEDLAFDTKVQNWPDLRKSNDEVDNAQTRYPCQWCHGAVGIGLSRIGNLKNGSILASDTKVVEDSLKITKSSWPNSVDTLCCGTLGSIEFLNEAGKIFEDAEIASLADSRLMAVIEASHEKGAYSWNAGNTQFNLGLFRGLSGVGYTLLRKIDPQIPNVLIWE